MADSSAAPSVTSTGAEFAKKVAHSQEHVQQHLIIAAVFALVVNFVSFCATLKKSPAWLGLTPCTFQTEDVASGITSVDVPFNKAIALLKLVPMVAVIISIGRNWRSGLLDKPRHFPFKIVSASWLWTCTTVLLAYSLFNVKVLTPHESIAEKSCNVGLSQLYFPNLTSGDFQQVEDSVKAFRGPLAIGYFANTLNLRVSDRHPNLEANLDGIGFDTGRMMNDSMGCHHSTVMSDSAFSKLYNYREPNEALLLNSATTLCMAELYASTAGGVRQSSGGHAVTMQLSGM